MVVEVASTGTLSGSLLEVVLDKVWVKHWEYKTRTTFKSLILKMWKSYNRFVLKITFVRIYIYNFLINIFIEKRSQSCTLVTVSLS
jgi:hypothetical protein